MRLPTRAHRPLAGRLVGAEGRTSRPEHPASEDDQQRREQRDHDEERHADADREHRAEARGGVELGEGQAQQADHDGGGAGQHRRSRAVQGERHRLVTVLVATELFSVARRQEQRVVGAGADDQDAEDRLTLPVDGEPGVLGQQVDHRTGHGQAHHGAEDRQDPEHRAAVGEEQDEDHDQERRAEQRSVDALERLGGVRSLTSETGQVDGDPVGLGDVADRVGGVGDVVPPVLAEVEREVGVGDGAVVGGELDRETGLSRSVGSEDAISGHALDRRHLGGLLVHRGEVGVGQAAAPVVDDQGGDVVGVDGRGQLVGDLGGLGRRRQPGRGLVVLDVGELAVEPHGTREGEDPEGQDDPLGDGAGQPAGDLTVHVQESLRWRGWSASGISLI